VGSDTAIAPMVPADLERVLDLNQRCTPHVGGLTTERLEQLLARSELALVARSDGDLAGFLIALGPGTDYDSPNYRWFSNERRSFTYVDRIAVEPGTHRSGIGSSLYRHVFAHAAAVGSERVTCEVNLDPPNPVSQRFHAALGFVEVGRQANHGGTVQVQLLERVLRPAPS
jgi:uncharacterized protein